MDTEAARQKARGMKAETLIKPPIDVSIRPIISYNHGQLPHRPHAG